MPSALAARSRKIRVDVEEGGAGDVALGVELTSSGGIPQLPAAVDELVAHSAIVTRTAPGGV